MFTWLCFRLGISYVTIWLISRASVCLSPFLSLSPFSLTSDGLKSAQSVLCPVSGIGTAFAVHKQVTLIGTGECTLTPKHENITSNIVTCVHMYILNVLL